MSRTILVLVALAVFISLAQAGVLSMRNKDLDGTLDISKTSDFSFIYQDTTQWVFESTNSYIPAFPYGAILGKSAFEVPGALRFQDNDLSAYLNGVWTSLITNSRLSKRNVNGMSCEVSTLGETLVDAGMTKVCSRSGEEFVWRDIVDLSAQFYF